MFKFKIYAILLIGSFNLFSQSEKKKKKLSVSGSIDTYFRTNFNAPNGTNAVAPGSSFANLSGFSLGMANVIGQYNGDKIGFIADLVFGPRGEDAIFNSSALRPDGSSKIVNQLYAYWKVNKNVKLTLGNFNTFLGYEVISPTANFNYSTSYLFSYGPFSHSGLKADITLSDKTSLMLAVLNPTDATEFNPTGNYAFGAQLGFKNQFLNLLIEGNAYEIDYTGGFDLSEKMYLGINAAYFNQSGPGFYGAALYPQYIATEKLSYGLRLEYFKELDGVFGAIGTTNANASVFAATLSANYKIEDLTIIPEIRIDNSSDDFFLDNNSTPKKNLSSFVLAAIYQF